MGLTADSGEPNGKREVCRMVALDVSPWYYIPYEVRAHDSHAVKLYEILRLF